MRVARWSTWKSPLSRSGSSISFSSSSRMEISRWTRDCSRRARLTNTSSFCSLPAWLESCAACTTAVTAPSWARARSAASWSNSSPPSPRSVRSVRSVRRARGGGCSPLRSASTRARRSASRRAVPRRRAPTRSCTERAARSAATAAMTMPARATAVAPPRTSHSAPVGLIPLERTVNSTAAQALRATATGGSTASRSSCDRMCDSGRPGAGRAGGRPCRPPSRRSGRGAVPLPRRAPGPGAGGFGAAPLWGVRATTVAPTVPGCRGSSPRRLPRPPCGCTYRSPLPDPDPYDAALGARRPAT